MFGRYDIVHCRECFCALSGPCARPQWLLPTLGVLRNTVEASRTRQTQLWVWVSFQSWQFWSRCLGFLASLTMDGNMELYAIKTHQHHVGGLCWCHVDTLQSKYKVLGCVNPEYGPNPSWARPALLTILTNDSIEVCNLALHGIKSLRITNLWWMLLEL